MAAAEEELLLMVSLALTAFVDEAAAAAVGEFRWRRRTRVSCLTQPYVN